MCMQEPEWSINQPFYLAYYPPPLHLSYCKIENSPVIHNHWLGGTLNELTVEVDDTIEVVIKTLRMHPKIKIILLLFWLKSLTSLLFWFSSDHDQFVITSTVSPTSTDSSYSVACLWRCYDVTIFAAKLESMERFN